mmetsp:Transcript_27903/g.43318  ORF Transcript_27903/g.43318 Transcript_27903/m.43318 type:complete len:219 (+) Transcript_27903:63-719(+)
MKAHFLHQLVQILLTEVIWTRPVRIIVMFPLAKQKLILVRLHPNLKQLILRARLGKQLRLDHQIRKLSIHAIGDPLGLDHILTVSPHSNNELRRKTRIFHTLFQMRIPRIPVIILLHIIIILFQKNERFRQLIVLVDFLKPRIPSLLHIFTAFICSCSNSAIVTTIFGPNLNTRHVSLTLFLLHRTVQFWIVFLRQHAVAQLIKLLDEFGIGSVHILL